MMKNKNTIEKIKEAYPNLTRNQKKIATYIHENYREIAYMSAQDLAQEISMSDTTIIRFSRLLGYDGFSDMKYHLRKESNLYDSPHYRFNSNLSISNSSSKSVAAQIGENDFVCYENFYKNFNRNLLIEVSEEIHLADTIHLVGLGSDATIATFLNWHLNFMGFNTTLSTEGGFGLAFGSSKMKEGDLLILSSSPRHLKDELNLAKQAKERNIKTVLITSTKSSELAMSCDKVLSTNSNNSYPQNKFLNSYVVYMALTNILLAYVFEKDKDKIYRQMESISEYADKFDHCL